MFLKRDQTVILMTEIGFWVWNSGYTYKKLYAGKKLTILGILIYYNIGKYQEIEKVKIIAKQRLKNGSNHSKTTLKRFLRQIYFSASICSL